MKPLLLLCLIILTSRAQSTECVDRFFKQDRVTLYLCQNYSNYSETLTLLYKARTKILSEYIDGLVKNGNLKDKEFHIRMFDPILSQPNLEITQSKSRYFINVSGFPSIDELFACVEYFARKDWKPFITNSSISKDVSIQMQEFYQDNFKFDLTSKFKTTFQVWSSNDLQLLYYNDSLKYYIDSTQVSMVVSSRLPVSIIDRHLYFYGDSLYVLKGTEIINRTLFELPHTGYRIMKNRKWVNVVYNDETDWILSYSYDMNKFYRR